MQERQKRIDAGEVVSDTSSMKARKKEKKKAYLAKIRKQQTQTNSKKSPKTIGKAQSFAPEAYSPSKTVKNAISK